MKRKLSKTTIWILVAVLAPPGLALFVFLVGQLVMSLWNWLLPPLFGLPAITFWQGLGLLMLCRILFGGFGSHSSGSPRSRSRSPEEQERVRQAMCERLGPGRSTGESRGSEVNPTTEN
jgi:hypothetical protein